MGGGERGGVRGGRVGKRVQDEKQTKNVLYSAVLYRDGLIGIVAVT